jgi:hypothetical protein
MVTAMAAAMVTAMALATMSSEQPRSIPDRKLLGPPWMTARQLQ